MAKKLTSASQESLLALLCYYPEGAEVSSRVPTTAFGGHFRMIAEKAIQFREQYGQPPAEHTLDLVQELQQEHPEDAKRIDDIYGSLDDTRHHIEPEYVLAQAGLFVRHSRLKKAIYEAVDEIEKGTDQSITAAESLLAEAVDGAQTQGTEVLNLGDLESEEWEWLWYPYVPLGTTTLLSGDPDVGKSTIVADLIARVTRGVRFPTDTTPQRRRNPRSVIVLTTEEHTTKTLRPKVLAADGIASRVNVLKSVAHERTGQQRQFLLEHDIPKLEKVIQRTPDCAMVTLDPISAYFGSRDSNMGTQVRWLLGPLEDLAHKYNIAIVSINHLNKGDGSKVAAMHRISGSLSFVAAPRVSWLATKDEQDPHRRMLLPVKHNLVPDDVRLNSGLAYRFDSHGSMPVIEWDTDDEVRVSADDALNPGPEPESRHDASEFLRTVLQDGPMRADELKKQASEAEFSWSTVKRANARDRIAKAQPVHEDGKIIAWEWALRNGHAKA